MKEDRSEKCYEGLDAGLLYDDLARLKSYETRVDSTTYRTILLTVFRLFGEGIVASLKYTMGKYLSQTNGALCNANREDWEIEAVQGMMSHNNFAKRPFAVFKAFAKSYPALSLRNLAWLSHSLVNGTHGPAQTFGTMKDREGINSREARISLTAHPELKIAVNIVCSVRRKNTGIVTQLVRVAQNEDKEEQVAYRKRKAEEKDTNNIRLKSIKAAKLDKAEHTASHDLVLNSRELEIQLAARLNSKQSQLTFLKEQFNTRVNSDLKRTYTTIGNACRKCGGGLRISSENPKQQLFYLTDLLNLMIQEDQDTLGINSWTIHTSNHEFLRFLPLLSKAFSNPKVKCLPVNF
jgi:hypothetical protein